MSEELFTYDAGRVEAIEAVAAFRYVIRDGEKVLQQGWCGCSTGNRYADIQ